jgi:hypothetical protein
MSVSLFPFDCLGQLPRPSAPTMWLVSTDHRAVSTSTPAAVGHHRPMGPGAYPPRLGTLREVLHHFSSSPCTLAHLLCSPLRCSTSHHDIRWWANDRVRHLWPWAVPNRERPAYHRHPCPLRPPPRTSLVPASSAYNLAMMTPPEASPVYTAAHRHVHRPPRPLTDENLRPRRAAMYSVPQWASARLNPQNRIVVSTPCL